MHDSKLEINGGQKYLIVYYDKRLDDFDRAIKTALLKHKLESGECPVLCLPVKEVSKKTHGLVTQGRARQVWNNRMACTNVQEENGNIVNFKEKQEDSNECYLVKNPKRK